MRDKGVLLTELAVIGYCGWQALDLPVAWWSTPSLNYAWVAFVIWSIPIVLFYHEHRPQYPLLALAIVTSLIGVLGSLNVFQHIGLVFALASLVPFTWHSVFWMITGVSWMPAFAWLTINFPTWQILFQWSLAASGVVFLLKNRRFAWR